MKVKCEYCAAMIESTLDKCPNCGATNTNMIRVVKSTPRTIAELKEWYSAHNLPPSNVTRFFIGENYTGAKAFGIYQDGDEFIVYKNKDTGERAIRYQGTDEAYAVNELYMKLKSEILNQKAHSDKLRGSSSRSNKRSGYGFMVVFVLFWVVLLTTLISGFFKGRPHYYKYDDTVYVQYYDSWYCYNDYSNDYYYTYTVPVEIKNNPADYEYDFKSYTWDTGRTSFTEFKDSDYYNENLRSSDSDSDSDYDWDSGSDSWDSGSTDWGSDW